MCLLWKHQGLIIVFILLPSLELGAGKIQVYEKTSPHKSFFFKIILHLQLKKTDTKSPVFWQLA